MWPAQTNISAAFKSITGVEGARFSDLGQLFACAKFRAGLKGVTEIAKPDYGQLLEQWLGHRWLRVRSACRGREAARMGIVRYSPASRLRIAIRAD